MRDGRDTICELEVLCGGGILNFGTLSITNSIFFGNLAGAAGGAIANSGTLTIITNSTFSDNSAAAGAAIYNVGPLTVDNSTFSGNHVGGVGGAIWNVSGSPLTITNSAFSGNSAGVNGGGISNGGDIIIINSTFSGNSAGEGGAIANGGHTVRIKNTIIANNAASQGGNNCANISTGTIINDGSNISNDDTCGFGTGTGANGKTIGDNVDPLLNPHGLTDNGGPTQTIALCTGAGTPTGCTGMSPAIDAIPTANCTDANGNALTSDQRGFVRPVDGDNDGIALCDIGAFESGSVPRQIVNDLVHIDAVQGQFFPPGAGGGPVLPYAPAGTFLVNPTFTNTSDKNICNVAFEVFELTLPNVMLDHRGGLVGSVGSILSAPVSGNVQHFLKGPTESGFSFEIGLGNRNPFQFRVNMLGDPTSGSCPAQIDEKQVVAR